MRNGFDLVLRYLFQHIHEKGFLLLIKLPLVLFL